jgi:hypothetical protein
MIICYHPFMHGATTNDNNTQNNHENSKLQQLKHEGCNYMCSKYSTRQRTDEMLNNQCTLHGITGCLDKTRVLIQAKPI